MVDALYRACTFSTGIICLVSLFVITLDMALLTIVLARQFILEICKHRSSSQSSTSTKVPTCYHVPVPGVHYMVSSPGIIRSTNNFLRPGELCVSWILISSSSYSSALSYMMESNNYPQFCLVLSASRASNTHLRSLLVVKILDQ